MKMLELVLKEQKRLKASGWKPKFRGDTGVNLAQLMIDNKVEPRNEWDQAFLDTFKQLNNKK
jgi:hypothetical protein|tara:strand:+ start:278 stop:463 length:186 start_codon:yes stop_codon:yes gene_type:complete